MVGMGMSGARSGRPVLVVGAGPTGLFAAIELLRRGVAVRLVDRLAEPPRWSQAIFIKQRTLEILAGLGLMERFAARGQAIRGVRFFSDGREVAAYDFEAIDSPYRDILSIPESETIAILIERLHELGGRIEHGTSFIGLEQDADGVTATLERAGVRSTVRVPFLVGADGYRSAVREAIGDAYDGTDYAELWGVFDTGLANWTRPRDTVCAQLETPLVLPFPLGADRWRIYFRPDAPGDAAVAAVLDRLRGICPDVALEAPEAPQYFHSHSRLARAFHIDRVFLAGDAAHASNPIQGHGMNAGIQDAHNLGWKLAAAVRGHATGALLASYDVERRDVDRQVVASGEEAYGWMTDASGEKIAALYEFLRTPEGQALAAIAETELDYCYAESPFIRDLRDAQADAAQKVGARVCDVDGLLHGGAATTLHAILADPAPTVLLLAGEAAHASDADVSGIEARLAPFDGVRLLTVVNGEAPAQSGVVADVGGDLHARFGASEPMLCVVRPDGHVSLCCRCATPQALVDHLGAMFRPKLARPGTAT